MKYLITGQIMLNDMPQYDCSEVPCMMDRASLPWVYIMSEPSEVCPIRINQLNIKIPKVHAKRGN